MKTFIKILVCLAVLSFNGCFNMYNEADEDMGAEYKYYMAIGAFSNIRMYSFDSEGVPSLLNNTAFGGSIYNIAVHPNGNYIYAADNTNNTLYTYQVDKDGSITNIDNQNTGASTDPYGVIVDPTGRYIYVSCSNVVNGNFILIYSIGSDGKLTYVGSGSTPASSGPRLMAFHPSGNYLYVTLNSGGGFSSFKVISGGNLSLLGTTSVSNNTYDIIVHPSGNYIYISSAATEEVYKYNIASDGTIVTASKITYTIGTAHNIALAIHPNGNYLYTKGGFSSYVYAYQINGDGTLMYADQSPDSLPTGICSIVVHPNGKNIYITDKTGGNRLNYDIILNSSGIFNPTYLHKEISNSFTSNPALIRKKIK